MFKVPPASLQTFIDTPNCVLEDRVQNRTVHIPNVLCDGHLQIINCGDCSNTPSFSSHRDFMITLYNTYCFSTAKMVAPTRLTYMACLVHQLVGFILSKFNLITIRRNGLWVTEVTEFSTQDLLWTNKEGLPDLKLILWHWRFPSIVKHQVCVFIRGAGKLCCT
jgi:hypothetical protein